MDEQAKLGVNGGDPGGGKILLSMIRRAAPAERCSANAEGPCYPT